MRLNTILLQVGVGVGVDISPTFLSGFNAVYEKFLKTKDAVTAESSYKAITCHRSFSLNDIDGATCGAIDAAVAIPFGYKSGFFHASGSSGGPAGGALIFSVPASVDPVYGFKFETSASAGRFVSLGNQYLAEINESRKQREMSRTPSSPLVRPAGGF